MLTDEQVIQVEKILSQAPFKAGDKVRYTGRPFDARGVGMLASEPPEFGVVKAVWEKGIYIAVEFFKSFNGGHSCQMGGLAFCKDGHGAWINTWQLRHVLPEEWPEEWPEETE